MKVYEIHLAIIAYAVAESEAEARQLAGEILRTEPFDPFSAEAYVVRRGDKLQHGPGYLVYGAESGVDLSLAEAVAKYAEAK